MYVVSLSCSYNLNFVNEMQVQTFLDMRCKPHFLSPVKSSVHSDSENLQAYKPQLFCYHYL